MARRSLSLGVWLIFLSLFVLNLGGCGSSGSTNTAHFPSKETLGKVSITYLTSSLPSFPNDPGLQVASVSFSFSGLEGGKAYTTAPTQKYLLDFEDSNRYQLDLLDIPISATQMTAVYYDAQGLMVAAGVEDLLWEEGNCYTAQVADPIITSLEGATASLVASKYTLYPGQETFLTYTVTPQEYAPIALSVFATYTQIDNNILPTLGEPQERVGGEVGVVPQPTASATIHWGSLPASCDPIEVIDGPEPQPDPSQS